MRPLELQYIQPVLHPPTLRMFVHRCPFSTIHLDESRQLASDSYVIHQLFWHRTVLHLLFSDEWFLGRTAASRKLLFRRDENKLSSLFSRNKYTGSYTKTPKQESFRALLKGMTVEPIEPMTFNTRGRTLTWPPATCRTTFPVFTCWRLHTFSVNTTNPKHVPERYERAFFHSWFTVGLCYTLVCKTHLIPPLCVYPEQ